MNTWRKLPVGIDSFEKIRNNDFYYVDKTGLIEQLLQRWGEVNLFTRPRRFGKTLNMSMLYNFFNIGSDPALFDGLYIASKHDLCQQYMGKYPVIFLSLKGVEGNSFSQAKERLSEVVGSEAESFDFLLTSSQLTENDKEKYGALIALKDGQYTMSQGQLVSSLKLLSTLLYKHYSQKVIILIDEYDVPLDKAFSHGYYDEMVDLIRGLFGQALKTNDALQFAVLTGCLRVSKESIFTGLNNFKVLSITDTRFDEQFGFTEIEVNKMLTQYELESHIGEIKEWYDGYRFGNADVYCPWDVINHVDRLRDEPDAKPQAYWINTSSNSLVRKLLEKADKSTKNDIECLMAGESIEKAIKLELTYKDIDSSTDNLWSVLFTTGYLTKVSEQENGNFRLKIPNEEIRRVYKTQILEWMDEIIRDDADGLKDFWRALAAGQVSQVQDYITHLLDSSISFFDIKGDEKENSYHMILAALLAANNNWLVKSNVEAGDGLADIIVETENPDAGIVVEIKHADSFEGMDLACQKALEQIKDRRYTSYLINNQRHDILNYGISFYKKRCKVQVERFLS